MNRWQLHRAAVAERKAALSEIAGDARFLAGLQAVAAERGQPVEALLGTAEDYLEEMVATHDAAAPEFHSVLSRIFDRESFRDSLEYDESALARLKDRDDQDTLVFATAHRSYIDFLVRVPFAEHGFTREYRFAGANINFWPMGPIGHALGIIYIRRGVRDPIYNLSMRHYVGWLAERRANFMWAIEGGRTRTGKLLRPKVGLLAYVADAFVDDRSAEVLLVPTTIVYEWLNEVYEYAGYGRGAAKTSESLVSMFRLLARQRKVPAEAKIYVGIGEPVRLSSFLERDGGADKEAFSEGITRAAFEVSRRIDAVTPISAVSMVVLPLLVAADVALTTEEVLEALAPAQAFVQRHGLPAPAGGAPDARSVERALGLLQAQGIVSATDDGGIPRWRVTEGRDYEAGYYRNVIAHHFMVPAVTELCLVRAAASPPAQREAVIDHECRALRELLTDEFFFPDQAQLQAEVEAELAAVDPQWSTTLAAPEGADELLRRIQPFAASQALAPFLEAWAAVTRELRRLGDEAVLDEGAFLAECQTRGSLDLSEGRLNRSDGLSLTMFDNALVYARRQGLLEAARASERTELAERVQLLLDAVSALEAPSPTVSPVGA